MTVIQRDQLRSNLRKEIKQAQSLLAKLDRQAKKDRKTVAAKAAL